jgi:hypothetical protein
VLLIKISCLSFPHKKKEAHFYRVLLFYYVVVKSLF